MQLDHEIVSGRRILDDLGTCVAVVDLVTNRLGWTTAYLYDPTGQPILDEDGRHVNHASAAGALEHMRNRERELRSPAAGRPTRRGGILLDRGHLG